jgi:hypothetical protein
MQDINQFQKLPIFSTDLSLEQQHQGNAPRFGEGMPFN